MKKIIICVAAILIIVYTALLFMSSNKEYAAEKLYYNASRRYAKIKASPDVAPPKMMASIKNDLEKIAREYPETVGAKSAHMALVEIYMSENKYDDALVTLNSLLASESENKTLLSRAHFIKALVYEKTGKWDKALGEFAVLKDKYVDTPLGLQAPLYVAQYYLKKGMAAEADREFGEASRFYTNLEGKENGTMLGYLSSMMLSQAYMMMKKYEDAGAVIENIIRNYPSQMTFSQQLPYVEAIFVKELKSPERAIGIYNFVITTTEDGDLKKVLMARVKELAKKP